MLVTSIEKDWMKGINAVTLVMFLHFAWAANVSALPYPNLGVKSGNWVQYHYQGSFSLTARWQKVEFLSIAETTVTVCETTLMPSGIEVNQTKTIDLASFDDFPMTPFSLRVLLVSADLKTGDPVYLGQFGNRTIVGETSRACAGVDRKVVYSNFTSEERQYTFYWDQKTGVLTEGTAAFGSVSEVLLATETNMWSGGVEWWLWAIVAIVIVCALIASRKSTSQKSRKKVNISPRS